MKVVLDRRCDQRSSRPLTSRSILLAMRLPVSTPIGGTCDPRFRQVRSEFTRNFSERGEVGAGVCIIVENQVVVDLVGGWSDERRERPWQPDTIVDFYSVGKAFVALLALRLIDSGLIGLDDPVASVWPEFAAAGKESATIRQALCHRAGVPAIRELRDE